MIDITDLREMLLNDACCTAKAGDGSRIWEFLHGDGILVENQGTATFVQRLADDDSAQHGITWVLNPDATVERKRWSADAKPQSVKSYRLAEDGTELETLVELFHQLFQEVTAEAEPDA